jgi:hypothetical protein
MRNPRLKAVDWEEIACALRLKVEEVGRGNYDEEPGEVKTPGSETSEWAVHLRRIISKINHR